MHHAAQGKERTECVSASDRRGVLAGDRGAPGSMEGWAGDKSASATLRCTHVCCTAIVHQAVENVALQSSACREGSPPSPAYLSCDAAP